MPQAPRGTWNPGRVLVALRERALNPAPVLAQIGSMLAERARRAFQEQRRGHDKWRPRNVPNIAGIVADLTHGKTPPMRRLDATPALIDIGTLMDSIAWRPTARNEIEVGTALPYASVHQFGGESVQSVTEAVKAGVRDLLTRSPWKDYENELSPLLRDDVTSWTTQIPPRPFVAVTEEDRKDIFRIVLDAWKGGVSHIALTGPGGSNFWMRDQIMGRN